MKELKELDKAINEFKGIDVEALKRLDFNKAFSFEEIYPKIEETHRELTDLFSHKDILKNSAYINQTDINLLKDKIVRFNQIANNILTFDLKEGGDPTPRRQVVINEIDALFTEIASSLKSLAAFIKSSKINQKEYSTNLKSKEEALTILLDEVKKSKKEVDGILQGLKDVPVVEGTKIFSKVFELQAVKHRDESKKWLWVSGTFFVALLSFIIWLMWFSNNLSISKC